MDRTNQIKRVDDMEQNIVDALGYEQAFTELSKALDYATKQEMYEYIIRMWDISEDIE